MLNFVNVKRVEKRTATGIAEMTLGKFYAFSKVVDVTYVAEEEDGKEREVIIPYDLRFEEEEEQHWTSMKFTVRDVNVEKKSCIVEVELTSSVDLSSKKIIHVRSGDALTGNSLRVLTRHAAIKPFAAAGNVLYCPATNNISYFLDQYSWSQRKGRHGSFYYTKLSWRPYEVCSTTLCQEEHCVDIKTWKFLGVEHAQLRKVPINVTGRLLLGSHRSLASDVAYVDRKAQVIYVLVKMPRDKINAVALLYESPNTKDDSVDNVMFGLSWSATSGKLSVEISVDDKQTVRLSTYLKPCSSANTFMDQIFSGDPELKKALFEHYDDTNATIVETLTSCRKKFTSAYELQESVDAYFRVLSMYAADSIVHEKDVSREVCKKFLRDQVTYGPINEWNVSGITDFTDMFAAYDFPYHVNTVNFGQWEFSFPSIESVDGMFCDVGNVSEVRLPLIYLVPSEETSASSRGHGMFEGSSIVRANVTIKCKKSCGSVNIRNMFANCRRLETVRLSFVPFYSYIIDSGTPKNIKLDMDFLARDCPVLRSVAISTSKTVSYDIESAEGAFKNCTDLQKVDFTPCSVVEKSLMNVYEMFGNCTKLQLSEALKVLRNLYVFSRHKRMSGMLYGTEAADTLCTTTGTKDSDTVVTITLRPFDTCPPSNVLVQLNKMVQQQSEGASKEKDAVKRVIAVVT